MPNSSRTTASPRRLLLAFAVAAGLLLAPASAGAEVRVEGTGEPAFTSSSNNTQFVAWNAPPGSDAYRLTAVYVRDGVEVGRETVTPGPLSGTMWMNWSGMAPLPLEEGHTYEICVSGAYSLPNDSLFFPEPGDSCDHGATTGKRTSTTIDRSKPEVSIQVAGGAAATRSTLLPVRIAYEDAHSAPFPANFLCVAPGDDANEACGSGVYAHSPSCSRPAGTGKTTTFDCEVETNGLDPADGRLFACVTAADSAVPDKPNSSDQTGNAGQANLSEKTCTSVILDRTAPEAAIETAAGTATSGQALPFAAQVADAHSGIAPGSVRWIWGDGSPASSGASATHAFAGPGTYDVRLEVADAAGNKTTVTREITVVPRPADGGGSVTACRSAMKKLAAAKTKLGTLKREAAPKKKIKKAKAMVKRAKAAAKTACAA
jgi:plastocyanin